MGKDLNFMRGRFEYRSCYVFKRRRLGWRLVVIMFFGGFGGFGEVGLLENIMF